MNSIVFFVLICLLILIVIVFFELSQLKVINNNIEGMCNVSKYATENKNKNENINNKNNDEDVGHNENEDENYKYIGKDLLQLTNIYDAHNTIPLPDEQLKMSIDESRFNQIMQYYKNKEWKPHPHEGKNRGYVNWTNNYS